MRSDTISPRPEEDFIMLNLASESSWNPSISTLDLQVDIVGGVAFLTGGLQGFIRYEVHIPGTWDINFKSSLVIWYQTV